MECSYLLLHFTIVAVVMLRATGEGQFLEEVRKLQTHPKITMPMWAEEVPLMWQGKVFTHKLLYVGELYVGTPLKKFTFVFDTGSGNTVVPDKSCSSLACIRKQKYDTASTSFSNITEDLALTKFPSSVVRFTYGDGNITGSFVRDRMCTEKDAKRCVVFNMISSIKMSTHPFALFSFDGLLGLGLGSLSTNFSFVQQMMEQEPRMLKQFSIFLGQDRRHNSITIGGYHEEYAVGAPKWVPVVMPHLGYWQVAVHTFSTGGIALDFCDDGECRAVTDLGSTLFSVPTAVVSDLQRRLTATVPEELINDDFSCQNFVKDVKVHLALDALTISIPTKELTRPVPFKIRHRNGTAQFVCTPKLHSVNYPPPIGPKAFILGHPLLRTYYTVYDWEKKQIGFALARPQKISDISVQRTPASPPVHIRSLDSKEYYLPHLTGVEPEMEKLIRRGSPES